MLYLIGINHRLQMNGKLKETKDFIEFLTEKSEQYNIEVIAEEFSTFALSINHIKQTTIQKFATGYGYKHIFIDPGKEERKSLKIQSRENILRNTYKNSSIFEPEEYKKFIQDVKDTFTPREEYWYTQIEPYLQKNIIVVCGWEHLLTFPETLKKHGQECRIFERTFG